MKRQTKRQTEEQLADRLRRAITRTSRRMRREAGGQLTPTQLASLASVDRYGVITPGELADLEGVRRPSVTRVVGNLIEEGVIKKQADPEDWRSSLLSVTPTGHAYLEEHRCRKSAWLVRMREGLDEDEVRTLEKAAAILEQALEEDRV